MSNILDLSVFNRANDLMKSLEAKAGCPTMADKNAASWQYEEGVLITGKQALELANALQSLRVIAQARIGSYASTKVAIDALARFNKP